MALVSVFWKKVIAAVKDEAASMVGIVAKAEHFVAARWAYISAVVKDVSLEIEKMLELNFFEDSECILPQLNLWVSSL